MLIHFHLCFTWLVWTRLRFQLVHQLPGHTSPKSPGNEFEIFHMLHNRRPGLLYGDMHASTNAKNADKSKATHDPQFQFIHLDQILKLIGICIFFLMQARFMLLSSTEGWLVSPITLFTDLPLLPLFSHIHELQGGPACRAESGTSLKHPCMSRRNPCLRQTDNNR